MVTDQLILQFGYLGLLIISAIAASIVPLSNEILVIAMPPLGFNPWLVGIVATIGNLIGALTMYWLGVKGTDYVVKRYKVKKERLEQAENWFKKWGAPSLLLAGLPIIGDPICLAAGATNMSMPKFLAWTFVGKGWRYVLILGALEWILNVLGWN
ncbi:MAG: membrane protein YqaA with SNARE-associated domain [Cellvibrionaceae bacterium]|jgi:membrane protein YqaA with SNARE-associated domain